MLTPNQRRELIEKIRDLPARLKAAVDELDRERLLTLYLDGEWSVAQNVHHIADSHMNSFIRMKLILTEERPTLKPYDQDRWVEMADENSLDIQNSIQILEGLHRRWVTLFESLTEAEWQRTGFHPELGEDISVEDLLQSYVAHGENHLDQIRRTLAAQAG